MTNTTLTSVVVASPSKKWVQLALGLLCMISISSPQYVWALLAKPFMAKLGVPLAEIQLTFSLLIILQTFFSPFQGKLIDKFGPRRLIAIGTVLSGASWMLTANISSLTGLYLCYGVIGGLGTGIVYIGVVGLMVRWFPEKRGFATGMVAAGYGMGAILTTFPVTQSLAAKGLESTLWQFGLLMAAIGFIASQGLRAPQHASAQPVSSPLKMSEKSFAPKEMLRKPLFWLMFVMMTMMSTSGLMVTSQMAIFADDFGITAVTVLGMAALPLAMTIDRFMNGLTPGVRLYLGPDWARKHDVCRLRSGRVRDGAVAVVQRRSAAVCAALRGGLFRLGRNLLALSGNPHRHLRYAACHLKLWLALYLAGDRLDFRRPAGGAALSTDRQLEPGVWLRNHAGYSLRAARPLCAETLAPAFFAERAGINKKGSACGALSAGWRRCLRLHPAVGLISEAPPGKPS